MVDELDRRPLVATVTIRETEPIAGFGPSRGPHVDKIRQVAKFSANTRSWCMQFGDLERESRDRLRMLFEVADEFGIPLELGLQHPRYDWRGPVLAQPFRGLTQPAEHGFIEPDGASTLLVMDVRNLPGGPTHNWWIAGEPVVGTHPAIEEAWAVLRSCPADEDLFAPPAEGALDFYGGPGQATVRGFWRGRWVQGEFTRADGAKTAQWLRLGALVDPWSVGQVGPN